MILKLPTKVSFTELDEDDNLVTVEAEVMFIDVKYMQSGDEGVENFVVLCADKDGKVYEKFLNETKIIEYDKNRSTWNPSKKRRRKRTGSKRNNNSPDKEIHPQERGSVYSGEGNPGETDGS